MIIALSSKEYLKIAIDLTYIHTGLHNYNNDNNIVIERILGNCC